MRQCQSEQRVVLIIKELHEKGLSLREIAKILEEMKIVTKNLGRRWHQEMVRRILRNLDRSIK